MNKRFMWMNTKNEQNKSKVVAEKEGKIQTQI